MGRRGSSGGRSSSRPAPRKTATTPSKSDNRAPPPASHTPTAAPAQPGIVGTVVGMIADGFLWSTGSALAHRAVESVVGPRSVQIETVAAPAPAASSMAGSDACSTHNKAFQDCLNSYGSDISKCQFYMDMLAACRKNPGSMM